MWERQTSFVSHPRVGNGEDNEAEFHWLLVAQVQIKTQGRERERETGRETEKERERIERKLRCPCWCGSSEVHGVLGVIVNLDSLGQGLGIPAVTLP